MTMWDSVDILSFLEELPIAEELLPMREFIKEQGSGLDGNWLKNLLFNPTLLTAFNLKDISSKDQLMKAISALLPKEESDIPMVLRPKQLSFHDVKIIRRLGAGSFGTAD